MSIQLINQIFMPSLASGACTMSDRGSPIAVPGVAAGGYNNNSHKQHRASTLIKAGRLALTISQWLLQIELIFRLLLKITVEEPHACDLTYLCPPRGGTIQEAFGGWTLAVWVTSPAVPGFDSEVKLYHDVVTGALFLGSRYQLATEVGHYHTDITASHGSSVGRAGDCKCKQQISLGR